MIILKEHMKRSFRDLWKQIWRKYPDTDLIHTVKVKQKIREACECPQADVYFLTGGTQTNAVVISSMLESYEGVVAAQTGHVACHEGGSH